MLKRQTLFPTTTYDLAIIMGAAGGTNLEIDGFSLNSVAVPEPQLCPVRV